MIDNTHAAHKRHGSRHALIAAAALAGLVPLVSPASPSAAQRQPHYDVAGKDIVSLMDAQARGLVTSTQLVDAYLARIRRYDTGPGGLHAVLALDPGARALARTLDRERAAGHLRGPLHGIPILVKDNIETAEALPTTAGSLALAGNLTRRDAPAIARLRAAGAIILGKTNLSEWANIRSTASISGWSAVGGLTRNAYDRSRSASGSSSGSGAAVAASLAAAAIGTETDGSVTCPAAVDGLVGIKPTVGLVSRTHVVPISHSQDTPGPLAHSVRDAALLLSVMAGSDAADAATAAADAHRAALEAPFRPATLAGLRLGVVRGASMPSSVRGVFDAALARLRSAGAVLVEVELPPEVDQQGDAELTVLLTELKADLAKYLADAAPQVQVHTLADVIAFDRAHAAQEMPHFGQELFERAESSGGLDDPAYLKARSEGLRVAGRDGIDRVLAGQQLAALIAPTMAPASMIDMVNGDPGGWSGPGSPPAIAGYPHLTLPMGTVRGLPVGMSVIGTAWQDGEVLAIGAAVADVLPQVPPPDLR